MPSDAVPRPPRSRPREGGARRPLALLLAALACDDDDRIPLAGDGEAEADTGAEWAPGAEGEEREQVATPGPLSFTEIHYHPPGGTAGQWLEVHNPMAFDVALTGWRLDGGVSFAFPEGTVLAAGGFLVVAADPGTLAAEGTDNALGPWTGVLDGDGERLDLLDNSGRRVDSVAYGTDDPWPVAPDGSGLTLAKVDHDVWSDQAENWAPSGTAGGSPGRGNDLDPLAATTTEPLVELASTWRYDASGTEPAGDWTSVDYDDAAWPEGEAVFYAGAVDSAATGTLVATADNYFAAYLGNADGTGLRWVGEEDDDDWTSVERFDVEVFPGEHLFVAAWELPGDSASPQMLIAEVDLPDDALGSGVDSLEWVLGPTGANPGRLPGGEAPGEDDLAALAADADATGAWASPGVEASRTADPWGYAVGSAFSTAASFVWGDTFDNASLTNTDDTFALFRSVDPLLGAGGTTEIHPVPTTTRFRTSFTLDADPSSAELTLACLLDDGAVVYLNGVEVLRHNLPAGDLTGSTLATGPVDAETVTEAISAASLRRGDNVLAAEVHQAEANDDDLAFGCALTARVSALPGSAPVVFNELPAAGEDPAWVELVGAATGATTTTGMVLATAAGDTWTLPAGSVGPGQVLLLEDLPLSPRAGEVLFLYADDGTTLLDAVRVTETLRGRDADAGPWRVPTEPTPGSDNVVDTVHAIVINEIQYHRNPVSVAGQPVTERDEEWLELYNQGTETVDLSGWRLADAVVFTFPAGTSLAPGAYVVVARDAEALASANPGIAVVGNFTGRLDNHGDRVLLLDARGNPADEVRYFDGGRWPGAADGGGSSLELRHPGADNAAPEAWAASDESSRASWVAVRYRGEAGQSAVGPDGYWEEVVLGLLDAGEVLVDDLSVVASPDTRPVELVQDGRFDDGGASWRWLGNHRHSEVVDDPDEPGNPVLRLVATGPTGHMHNHAETTTTTDIGSGEVEVSFRARWVWGSNQLNTRLYFNRLPVTTRVDQPERSGTPGAANSRLEAALGPTFDGLEQDVAVPAAGTPVRLSIGASDPEGVASVRLWSSIDGGAFTAEPMVEGSDGRWEAELAGQPAGTRVLVYVEATDHDGNAATFPAAGPDARAIVTFDGGEAATHGLHNLRILLTEADAAWLHDEVNLMSDDPVGATVVYDESEVFYDVGVRLKGSQRGRPTEARLGYGIGFHAELPFRGRHGTVLVDRSEGVGFGQREVLHNLVMTHAGSVSAEYNDLVHVVTPYPEHTGTAELQLDRASDLLLAAQFEDGADGRLFEYELIYYPLTTDDGTAEGQKLPQPDYVVGTAIADLGDDPENYRWNFLVKNNERADDYQHLVRFCQSFGNSGNDLSLEAEEVIDVDQWLRAFAFATLAGAVDNYGGDGSQHNALFYVRPSDDRVLYFPHDLDFFGSSNMAVVGNADLARLLLDPSYARAYYGHLADIITHAYNAEHLAPWCAQLQSLLPDQDIDGHCAFVAERADWVWSGSSASILATFPEVEFVVTTNGGADFSTAATRVTLEGQGWVDVRAIEVDGEALDVAWLDGSTWSAEVALQAGDNAITLVATDFAGRVVGTDSLVVTSTGG